MDDSHYTIYREYKRGRTTLITRLHSHLLANAGWWYMPPLNNDNGEGHRLLLTLDIIKTSIYLTKNKDKFAVYTT